MLIFTNRMGDEITVTVLSIRGNQVRIGIDTPVDAAVNREKNPYVDKRGQQFQECCASAIRDVTIKKQV